jgi:AcrR family transcriptional regulator
MASAKPRKPPAAKAPKGDTKERILAAALVEFSANGFDGTTTADIAAQAGVAEKTLFAHFGTKEKLYRRTLGHATLDLLVPDAIGTLAEHVAGPVPSLDKFLTGLMKNRVGFAKSHSNKLKLALQEVLLRPAEVARMRDMAETTALPIVFAAMAQLRERGELRDIPPRTLLRVMLSLVGGYLVGRFVLFPDADWEDEEDIAATVDIVLNGISRKKKGLGTGDRRPATGNL